MASLEEPHEEPSVSSSVGSLQIREKPDSTVRGEVYNNLIDGFISTGVGKKLRIIVIGEAGQGKSTLINALVGEEVANEGDAFEAGTNSVQQYVVHQNGVEFAIWDTPGFGMGEEEEDEKIVEQLERSDCFPADLVLFCIRMDQTRIPSRIHSTTIKTLTEVFSEKFWKHALFVLTFANNVTQLCPEGQELELFFSLRCIKIQKQLRETVNKHAKLSPEELNGIKAVPVGSCKTGIVEGNPWMLPDREDWFLFFWMDVANRMSQSALSTLLQGNRHRLVSDAHASSSPDMDFPHQRKLEATPDEIETVEKNVAAYTSHGPSEALSHKTKKPNRTKGHDKPNDSGGNKPKIHHRKIPVFTILKQQLEKENSGFITYLRIFAAKRGEELKLIGHFGGLLEGFVTYLSRDKKQVQS